MLHTVANMKLGRALTLGLLIALGCAGCAPIGRLPATDSPTLTASPDASSTATPVPSNTLAPSLTETPTITPTSSLTFTPSETSTITLTPSRTPIPSPTSTPIVPRVSITTGPVSCRYGPGAGYEYKYGLLEDNWEDVIGRVQILSRQTDGTWAPATWLLLQSMNLDPYSKCWVNAWFTQVIRGDLNTVPDYFSKPKAFEIYGTSHLYPQPADVSARRDGNTVTVFWQPVNNMTEDDYVGYMIEALHLLQRSLLILLPVSYSDSFSKTQKIHPGRGHPRRTRVQPALPGPALSRRETRLYCRRHYPLAGFPDPDRGIRNFLANPITLLRRSHARLRRFRPEISCLRPTHDIDELRERDYGRLDRLGQVYLDYTGGGLYAESQLRAIRNCSPRASSATRILPTPPPISPRA